MDFGFLVFSHLGFAFQLNLKVPKAFLRERAENALAKEEGKRGCLFSGK